jgi:phosphoribosylaminoimidazolecarboxamide formyltransferase/IMP cyclohydrolase
VLTDTSGGAGFPAWVGATWDRASVLRYGENPHQAAALYVNGFQPQPGLAQGEQLHGKEMSYNNYIDADAAYRAAYDHGDLPTVAIIKHANPCGIAIGAADEGIASVHAKAHACDPVSAYGGIIATNRPVSLAMAETVKDIFTEVVVAPGFDDDALEVLTTKKNLRLLKVAPATVGGIETRPISGGLLMQARDAIDASGEDKDGNLTGDDLARWRLVAGDAADDATLADLQFAWRAIRAVKSNAILLASGGAAVGVGMGQVNRVDSCHLAVTRAGDRARGSVAASDAFFPFADGPQILLDAGVKAIVAPGGSIRDEEVIEAVGKAGVTMYFTGTRHFAH